jgi:hypothetical protein
MPRTEDPMAYAFAHDAGLGQESATVPSRQAVALNSCDNGRLFDVA